ncbi:MAG: hypothetical protein KAI69_05970 [Deltaproteobacteria bacterium]|nr:hypothetical protein [Deltaproteobacteria bacterium]
MTQPQPDKHFAATETSAETIDEGATESDSKPTRQTPDETSPEKNKKKRPRTSSRTQPKGIAALFEKEELKGLFSTYLITICVIEGFIFFVSFLSQMGPETVPFPWKSYFFAAFIIPLTITFLLGIIVISFDRYIFGHQPLANEIDKLFQTAAETRSRIHKFHAFLYVLRQIPFLLGLLSLVALSGIAYKLDDILTVIGHVGGRTAHYLFIGLAIVFGVAVVIGLIWMFLSYSLRKKTLEYQYQYKKDVIDKTGLVIIGEDRVMDREGRILSFGQARLNHKPQPDDDEILIIDQT